MADVQVALNDQFYYNSMLAKSLLQLLPEGDRQSLRLWLEKLFKMDKNNDQIIMRTDYMWFILLMLQSGKIREPFNQLPPETLGDLKEVMPPRVFEEVLLASDKNMSWALEGAGDEDEGDEDECAEKQEPSMYASSPEDFIDMQPMPNEGMVCYMAAFSDQDF